MPASSPEPAKSDYITFFSLCQVPFSGRRHFLMNFFFKSPSSGFRFPSPLFPPTFFLPGMSAGGSSAKPRYRRFFAPPRALFSAAFAAASPERLAIIPSPLPFVNTFLSFCF
jgi:hypothetical protein